MKPPTLPLLALTLLLGACSSSTQTGSHQATPPSRPAIPTGTRATAWGERPSYDQGGHSFKLGGRPSINAFNSTVVLDVLVNPDGTVQDVALLEGSGNAAVDRNTLARFKHARYSLKLAPDDPAPHVVRQTVEFKTASAREGHDQRPIDTRNYSSAGPQPSFSGPPPATYSYSTSNP